MNKDSMHQVENYFEVFIILFLIGIFLLMIGDFLLPILFATSLVFIFYKPYKALLRKTQNSFMASFFMTLIVLLLILLPLYMVIFSLISETSSLVVKSGLLINSIDLTTCTQSFCEQIEKNLHALQNNINNMMTLIGDKIVESLGVIFSSVTSFFVNFFIFLFSFFFMLKDGHVLLQYLRRIVPMKNSYKDALFIKFRDVSSAVFIHSIFIAIIQGILVGIGFFIFGLPSPIFWFVMASFAALLPFFGAGLVWIPGALYFLIIGDYIFFLLLSIYGLFIVSLVDNILRPMLMKKKVHVHSFLIFLSIFGGLQYFGFVGLFLGPIIISLLVSVLQLYDLNFR